MGYQLCAAIAGSGLLREAVAGGMPAAAVELGHGLALMPMTEALFDAVPAVAAVADRTKGDDGWGFRFLPRGFGGVLERWSAAGPVAYVEAEYFGGVGAQRAAVWSRGALTLGPLGLDEGEPVPAGTGTPVSAALRALGVRAEAGSDEFDTVGLRRHRHTENWC